SLSSTCMRRTRKDQEGYMTCRLSVAAAILAVALSILSGCSDDPPTAPAPTGTTTPPGGTSRPVDTPPSPVDIEVPATSEGMAALLQAGPTTGSARVGRTSVTGDVWWINVNCRGGGVLTVEAAPVVSFEVPCNDPIEQARNQFDLGEPYDIEVSVEAPDGT